MNSPKTYNEKLQWLKLNYKNPLIPTCVDKYAVRRFVEERIGSEYLNECIGVYDNVEEVPFDDLPNRFVLKAAHGSGWNIICPDKSRLDREFAKRTMRKWLKSDFSVFGREWQYKSIPHRIVCEKFIEDSQSGELRDYKLFTFKGETKYIWVDFSLGEGKASDIEVSYSKPKPVIGRKRYRNFYDAKWKFQKDKGCLYENLDTTDVPRPACLEKMLELARKLSCDFPQCRVDFYVLGGERIVFGELTFSSGNGCNEFYPNSFDAELGQYIDINGL